MHIAFKASAQQFCVGAFCVVVRKERDFYCIKGRFNMTLMSKNNFYYDIQTKVCDVRRYIAVCSRSILSRIDENAKVRYSQITFSVIVIFFLPHSRYVTAVIGLPFLLLE
jgi:hypothetical protein